MYSYSASTTLIEEKNSLHTPQSSLHSIKRSLHSIRSRKRISVPEKPKLNAEQILAKYTIYGLLNYSKDGELIDEKLEQIDEVELLEDVETLAYQLGGLELENCLYTNYLETHSPEMLLSVSDMHKAQQQQQQQQQQQLEQLEPSSLPSSVSSGGSVTFSDRHTQRTVSLPPRSSGASGANSQRSSSKRSILSRQLLEQHLNARTKAALAERAVNAAQQRLAEHERRGTNELKALRARQATLQAHLKDTNELLANFKLHFYRDADDLKFIESASEYQLQMRFIKYTKDFFRTARTLTGILTLATNSLANTCVNTQILLEEKHDLFGVLCEADYELLPMQLAQAYRTNEDRQRILRGIQNAAVKTEMCLLRQIHQIEKVEAQIAHANRRNIEMSQYIARLAKETEAVRQTNANERRTLQQMRQMHAEYMAPSVLNYVELKEECNTLEKLEKMLQRKIAIAKMKLKNMHIRAKQQRRVSLI